MLFISVVAWLHFRNMYVSAPLIKFIRLIYTTKKLNTNVVQTVFGINDTKLLYRRRQDTGRGGKAFSFSILPR